MSESPQPATLHCELCPWFGASSVATKIGMSRAGQEWYLCDFHAQGMNAKPGTIRTMSQAEIDRRVANPHIFQREIK